MSNFDINVKILETSDINDSNYDNYLKIELSGKDINYVIVNTIRRVIMELIPSYAFDPSDISIHKNTSIYNNDYMRLRISNFPIHNIDNNESTLTKVHELEYESNLTIFDKKIEDLDLIEEKEKKILYEKANNFIMDINVKNNTQFNMNVTTDMAKFKYKTQTIKSPYTIPLLILKLKPSEEFNGTAISSLNIPLKNAIYLSCCNVVYSEINPNKYVLYIRSYKQITEKNLIIRACKIIIQKLESLNKVIMQKINSYTNEVEYDNYNLDKKKNLNKKTTNDIFELELPKHKISAIIKIEYESHTFGNLITRFLQDHNDILYAGYKIDHLLIKELTIAYKTNNIDIISILNNILDKNTKLFNKIIDNII